MAADAPKTKVAILGGGVGALTTAFMLSDRPELRARYDVTVYQLGWRLGGKGASGRNSDRGERVEEHGIHFFMGFYANAFWLMQKCYRELARPQTAPLARWDDAFKPHSLITLLERTNDRWVRWRLPFPLQEGVQPGFPGADEIPAKGGEPSTVWEYVTLLLGWLGDRYLRLPADVRAADLATNLRHARQLAEAVINLPEEPTRISDLLVEWSGDFAERLDSSVEARAARDDDVRHLWILLRLGTAVARGLIADRVALRGFNFLDGEDLRQWLRRHGAPDRAVWSAPVQAIYDLVFAYEKGDTRRPNLAAGTALRGVLRLLFDYRGAPFWRMQAGMGDVVFAPLYEVLKRRGVKFRFFHRVENLGLSGDGNTVATIDLTVQATVRKGQTEDGEYCPLHPVKGLPCWPSAPLYAQLEEGDSLKCVNLESAWTTWKGKPATLCCPGDFDVAVLGISLGALPWVCKHLIGASREWQGMVRSVQTVQTQAFQLWLKPDARGLGWYDRQRALFGSYVQPWNSIVDMSQLIPREDFPATHPVNSVAYSCGPFQNADVIPPPGTDPAFPDRENQRVYQNMLDFLLTSVRPLWPPAADGAGALNWDLLVDLDDRQGPARLNSQFCRGNIDPCERYVLSVKGSTGARLPADRSGFRNLYLAGDWTATGLNAGCVEAAVMSGMRAAQGLCGYPGRIVGENDR
jgi:uncharacterized protein with NAD-binding domain and iron-sulfur cluster